MAAFLLDTETFFDVVDPGDDRHPVVRWVRGVPAGSLWLSVVTLGEFADAIERLDGSDAEAQALREGYRAVLEREVPRRFWGRILPVDERIGLTWGRVRRLAVDDAPTERLLLCGTALAYNLVLATRRRAYHARLPGLAVFDPYAAAGAAVGA
ncbi:MAG TPA: hypothetical protein VFG47_14835 [Geminicoccaceae bacterium]|nr:hypothetical protein [Geminicoccaceae bacterium]